METMLEPQLRAVLAQARRIAAAFRASVEPRELLLAAAMLQPQLVVATAKRCGIEVRRLLWALREWGPINPVAPAVVAETALTPAAEAFLSEVAQSAPGRGCEGLVERLLNPVRLAPSRVPAVAPEADVNAPPPDLTAVVLSRLGLI